MIIYSEEGEYWCSYSLSWCKCCKFQLPDGCEMWYMSSHDYVLNAVMIVEGILAEEGMKLKGKANRPFPQH